MNHALPGSRFGAVKAVLPVAGALAGGTGLALVVLLVDHTSRMMGAGDLVGHHGLLVLVGAVLLATGAVLPVRRGRGHDWRMPATVGALGSATVLVVASVLGPCLGGW